MKRSVKRAAAVLLILAMLFSVAACGSSKNENADASTTTTKAPENDTTKEEEPSDEAADFTYIEENGGLTLTSYTGNEAELLIPASIGGKAVKAIGDACFQGLTCLQIVEFPEGVERIGAYAFECCSRLEKVYFPNSLISIGDGAFSGCGKLYLADMQDQITSIGTGAFLFCGSLIYVQLPAELTTLGNFAFQNCNSLTYVNFRGNKLAQLPDRTFYYCINLQRISFCESITSIGKRALAGCESLNSFYFPGQVTEVGEYAFANCISLTYKPLDEDFVPENAYVGCNIEYYDGEYYEDETPDEEEESYEDIYEEEQYDEVSETTEEEAEDVTVPDFIGSIAGERSLFNPDDYKDYKIINNDEFEAWSEKYLDFCNAQGVPTDSEEMVYIMLYKGEVIPHYVAMAAVESRDPGMMEEAAQIFGDDFEETYQMMNHGLFTELRRGRMCDNLVLYSGVYDSQLMAAAGTTEVPTLEQLADAVGTTFTDPIMISTTTDIEVATNFSDTLFIIYASAESMDKLGAVSIDSIIHTNEKEILMCCGATYQILDVGTMEITVTDWEGNESTIYRNYVTVVLQ